MPELPEVETVRRGLEQSVVGSRIVGLEVGSLRLLRRQSHAGQTSLIRAAVSQEIRSIGRHGKFLLIPLGPPNTLVFHLGMSGQISLDAPDAESKPHTHVRIDVVSPGGQRLQIRMIDPRTFGEVFLGTKMGTDIGAAALPDQLRSLGPDALSSGLSAADLRDRLSGKSAPMKSVLLDQRVLAGIGNIYSDEILFESRVHPLRAAGRISVGRLGALLDATERILGSAVEHRGSTLADRQYRDLLGDVGDYQRFHAVYAKDGEPCPRCEQPIRRIRLGGRSTHYCANCQR